MSRRLVDAVKGPERGQAGKARIAISAVFAASGIAAGAWASQIPRIKDRFGFDDAGLGLVVLAFAIGAIVAMPVTGLLAARVGSVRVVVAMGVASALGIGVLGLSPSVFWLFATTLLAGAAIGGLDAAMNAQATSIERAWRGPIMSSIHGFFSLGGLAGAAVGGVLTGAGVSLPVVLATAGLIVLLACLPGARWLHVPGEHSEGAALLLPRRPVLAIGLLCFAGLLVEGAIADWTSVYLHDVARMSIGWSAAGFAGFSLTMAATRFAGDRVVRRFGPVPTVAAGGSIAAAGIGLACAWPASVPATAGFALTGLGLANIMPVLMSAAGRIPGIAPSAGIAMTATLGYGAFLLGPPAIGFIAQAAGLRVALLLLVLCSLIVACGASAVRPRARPHTAR